MKDAWTSFWFTPGSAVNLAAARIVVAGHALWVLLSRDLPGMSRLPDAYWWTAEAGAAVRFFVFRGQPALETALMVVCAVLLVCVLLGRFVWVTALGAAVCLYHFGGLQSALYTLNPANRGFTFAVIALVILAASRCDDALVPGRSSVGHTPAWEYRWPLKLMQTIIASIYLFGFVGKLHFGLEFFSIANIQRQAIAFQYFTPHEPLTSLGTAFGSSAVLAGIAVALVVVVEAGMIGALMWDRVRRILVPVAVMFHVGILMTLQVVFLSLPHLLLFVQWDGFRPRTGAVVRD